MTTSLDHIDGLRDVFTDITQDCLMLDLTPYMVQVCGRSGGKFEASVQFVGADVAAVQALADSWGLPRGRVIGGDKGTYIRDGRFDLHGRAVAVQVFTGHPGGPLPPAGYRPVPTLVVEVDA